MTNYKQMSDQIIQEDSAFDWAPSNSEIVSQIWNRIGVNERVTIMKDVADEIKGAKQKQKACHAYISKMLDSCVL